VSCVRGTDVTPIERTASTEIELSGEQGGEPDPGESGSADRSAPAAEGAGTDAKRLLGA
jgi:hypothetical protein